MEFVHGWWNILPSAVLNEDVRDDPFEFEVSAVSIKSRPPRRRIAAGTVALAKVIVWAMKDHPASKFASAQYLDQAPAPPEINAWL